MKFKDVRAQWWAGHVLGRREVTLYRRSEAIRCHISPFFDEEEIAEITDVEISRYIKNQLEHGNRLTGGPLNTNSVRRALQLINLIMEYAVLKHYISENPMALVPRLKPVSSFCFKVFTSAEVAALIKAARPKWLGDMILLSYHTAMRKEEVFGLKWSDVDISNRCLYVNTTIVAISPQKYFVGTPKTKASKRCILLDSSVIDMLLRRQRKSTCEWVFENKLGTEINPWYNVKYFRRAITTTGIGTGRFHDLRHTHITELVDAGIPLPVIQARAGHSDIKMTMRYTHITPTMQASVIQYLENR